MAQALGGEYPGAADFDGVDDPDWMTGLWRCVDHVPTELLGTDGGEPEDNSFRRDWSWVPTALLAAYDRGLNEAAVLAGSTIRDLLLELQLRFAQAAAAGDGPDPSAQKGRRVLERLTVELPVRLLDAKTTEIEEVGG